MIIIGTRGSELALWQSNFTKDLLEKQGHEVEIKIIELFEFMQLFVISPLQLNIFSFLFCQIILAQG
jgi:hypothetical protein